MASKQCNLCKLNYSTTNFSKHYKSCQKKHGILSPVELQDLIIDLRKQLEDSKIELTKANYRIEELTNNNNKLVEAITAGKVSGSGMASEAPSQVVNITNGNVDNSTTTINNYYVLDANGIRDGIDMTKLRAFGDENVDYVDKTQPLTKILKDIYCNDDHLENRVVCHEFLNLEWILFKCKKYIVRLHLEPDRESVPLMVDMMCNNVQKLLGTTYENPEERADAVNQLLVELDKGVKKLIADVGLKEANNRMPVWNNAQHDNYEERRLDKYIHDPFFSHHDPEFSQWVKQMNSQTSD